MRIQRGSRSSALQPDHCGGYETLKWRIFFEQYRRLYYKSTPRHRGKLLKMDGGTSIQKGDKVDIMSLREIIETGITKLAWMALRGLYANSELTTLYVIQGQAAAQSIRRLDKINRLADAEFCVFSQWGEDGIIEWLVHHMGTMPESFVEFGVETYRESNTRFLLVNRNWRGVIIDGSPSHTEVVKGDSIYWRHDLTVLASFVTRDNINELIGGAGLKDEIGILSVDIDGNDYWVWDALNWVNPQIVIMEYNSAFGDLLPLSIPYDAGFVRTEAHFSNLYFGASIGALNLLAERKGYTLLGSNRAGSNAFYVRNDLLARFEGRIADTRPVPSRFREARAGDGNLTYARGQARFDVIADCPVVNVADGKLAPLRSHGSLYSSRWMALLEGKYG